MSAAVRMAESAVGRLAGNVGRVVWMRATYRLQEGVGAAERITTRCARGRQVFVLRHRLVGVSMRRPAVVAYPGGARGRVRLFGFDDLTLAVPLDTAPDSLPDSLAGTAGTASDSDGFVWWPAMLTAFDPRSMPIPADLSAALSAAGVELTAVAMAAQRRHAVMWIAAASSPRIRALRVAAVVDAARSYGAAAAGHAVPTGPLGGGSR
jgi:hypothetical protein